MIEYPCFSSPNPSNLQKRVKALIASCFEQGKSSAGSARVVGG
jgi:hypothetical protein